MLQRLPLPAQFDRVIMQGGLIAGLVAAPILVGLILLVALGNISGAELVFWLAASIVIAGALGAVLSRNVVYAALSLIATLLGVAALFLLLASEFLALVQVLVYGGGVIILLIFGLMLTNAADDPVVTDGTQRPFGFGVALVIGSVFVAAILEAQWGAGEPTAVPFVDIGERLFTDFMVPVIIVAVLLDIALSGAFVNARPTSDAPADEPRGEAAS